MWQCPNCNKENNDNRDICWSCSIPKNIAVTETLQKTVEVVERPTVCTKCSAPLDEDSMFCPKCAAPVLLHSTINCPKCYKTVDASAKFCKYCATDLTTKSDYRFDSTQNYSSASSSFNSQEINPDMLVIAGGALAVISAMAFFWGMNYTNNFANQARAGFGQLIGQTDSTYSMAQASQGLGILGFVIGVGLLIFGFYKRSNR